MGIKIKSEVEKEILKEKCNICNLAYKHLKEHIQRVHGNKNVKNFRNCKLCGTKFPSKSELRLHIESEHKNKVQHCDICT